MEFWFLAAVATGLLCWGHLISSDIVDLIAQILFNLWKEDTLGFTVHHPELIMLKKIKSYRH